MGKSVSGKRPLLDTNVLIERDIPSSILTKVFFSSVVLYELTAANIDNSTFKRYASWRTIFADRLLTPTATDWFECSKIVRNMLRGQKSKREGQVPKITSAQQQQNDALIARNAVNHDCFVVTNNVKDFDRFLPYMKGLIIVPADDFFD
ncbi:MAG: type II toxin-antitoxin system VapC family toxin [Pyrinomonadaceae bacterium]